ncbi:hypothetical protein GOODEAATRI_016814 [Goodea atripinnis]|uniref:Uncharacterized protein n=1 Tax=Goodea atripinnis TaxID=208336 RepID=A0ABV0PZ67_9TELE
MSRDAEGIRLPFTSNARLKVEEANFAVTAIPPSHMILAPAISCHRGVAIKTLLTALALVALCMPEALQASPGKVVTDSHSIKIHVSTAGASFTGPSHPGCSQGVTVVAIFTNLTANACTCIMKGERGKGFMATLEVIFV